MLRSRPPARLVALLAPFLLGACIAKRPFTRRPPPGAVTRVEVSNDRFEDLTVYLNREGGLFRLGIVPGKGTRTLTIPDELLRLNCTLRLVARTAGREAASYSEPFGMGPGSRLIWRVPLTTGETPVLVQPPAF